MENRQGRPPIIPLEVILGDERARDLKGRRVEGVIPIEVSIEDLQLSARARGLLGEGEEFSKFSADDEEFYWFKPAGDEAADTETGLKTNPKIYFIVKRNAKREVVYILDEQFDSFKEFFLEGR